MNRKDASLITKIMVNRTTFHNEPIEDLSFVNFFYGNNGTGKSTIAKAIAENDGTEWTYGRSAEDYEILVYNREFVEDHFSNYRDLPGVFIFNKINKDVQGKIDEKSGEKDRLSADYLKTQEEWRTAADGSGRLLKAFQDACFKKTAAERSTFDKALGGRKQKKGFTEAILAERNPTDHDPDALKRLCDAAFDADARTYHEFQRADGAVTYGRLPGKELLASVIVSSANTDFARFIRKIKATDWVREGHTHYISGSGGRCPFCQQKLPDTFEEDIRKCFDAQYQENVAELVRFRNTYDRETQTVIKRLEENLSDTMQGLDTELFEYRSKLNLLKSRIEVNSGRLADKVREPSRIVSLEDTDSLLLEIGGIIDTVNQKIRTNNEAVSAGKASKEKCRREVMEYFAFLLQDEIKDYLEKEKAQDEAVRTLEAEARRMKKAINDLSLEISALNRQAVNTEAAVDGINQVLKDAGFQGFRLRECRNHRNHYEIIRDTGEAAENLSDGERNFIAFLYFHQLVKGSRDSEERKDKIVVIDDPVSGMDSSALFLVSRIVREMISICRNNTEWKNSQVQENYIKQIFILTHNAAFHREITCQQTGYYDCTTFYIIRKKDNISRVHTCVRYRDKAKTELENYNPVQSSYESLWEELRNADSAIPALSVMRRILAYYFLQVCGYEENTLREQLLEDPENKKNFIKEVPGGTSDTTEYEAASAMLTYIGGTGGIADGQDFIVEDFDDVELYQRVFKRIFYVMHQERHYNMMTAAAKTPFEHE